MVLLLPVCGVRFEEEEKRRKQQVAAQRRRWKVRFFTESGKPDKRRAPGRPWLPSAIAGPERDIFCGGAWRERERGGGEKPMLLLPPRTGVRFGGRPWSG